MKNSRFELRDTLIISIPIDPVPTKATQFAVRGRHAIAYTPDDKRDYMKKCLKYLYPYAGWSTEKEPIKAVFKFYRKPTKEWKDNYWLMTSVDTDNLVKPIKDCLGTKKILKTGTKGDYISGAGVIVDDHMICHEVSMKMASDQPRIVITLSKIFDTLNMKPKQQQLWD